MMPRDHMEQVMKSGKRSHVVPLTGFVLDLALMDDESITTLRIELKKEQLMRLLNASQTTER